jgi:hypothetical protein
MCACWSAFKICSSEMVPPKLSAEMKESANVLVICTNSLSVESKCNILRLLILLCSRDFRAPCWILSCSVLRGGRRKDREDNSASLVVGKVSVSDRTEAVSLRPSSVSYLNFASELIFLVISAMVVSVRFNFGATI